MMESKRFLFVAHMGKIVSSPKKGKTAYLVWKKNSQVVVIILLGFET